MTPMFPLPAVISHRQDPDVKWWTPSWDRQVAFHYSPCHDLHATLCVSGPGAKHKPKDIMSLKYKLKRLAGMVLNRGLDNSTTNLSVFNESAMRRALYFSRLMSSVRDVDGAIVECGVGQGRGLAMWTSLSLLDTRERQIWAFDSFEGFPKLSREDEATAEFEAGLSEYRDFTVLYVFNTLQQFGISRSDIDRRISFAKGYIPESLGLYDGKPVALLHLDLDIYEPYKAALEYFWDLLAPGGDRCL